MAWREDAQFTDATVTNLDVTNMLDVAFSIGAEATNAITTAITVTGAASNASLGVALALPFYISSDAVGQTLEAGTDTYYINLILPNGRIATSGAITLAA